jgi:hypothetical protein
MELKGGTHKQTDTNSYFPIYFSNFKVTLKKELKQCKAKNILYNCGFVAMQNFS